MHRAGHGTLGTVRAAFADDRNWRAREDSNL